MLAPPSLAPDIFNNKSELICTFMRSASAECSSHRLSQIMLFKQIALLEFKLCAIASRYILS